MKIKQILLTKVLPLFLILASFPAFASETCIVSTVGGIVKSDNQFVHGFKYDQVCTNNKATKKIYEDKKYSDQEIIETSNTFEVEQRNKLFSTLESLGFQLRVVRQLEKQSGDNDPLTQAVRYEMYFVKE